jgi:hypothetical protein
VIFDFSGVTGIDSSAGACCAKIRDVLCKNTARQVMAALSPADANILSASDALDGRVGRSDHLDEALEEAEEMLLAASRGNPLTPTRTRMMSCPISRPCAPPAARH